MAIRIPLKAYLSADHVSAATGKTLAVVISKNGGAFANPSAGATNATEISNGWYYVTLSTTDTATLGPLIVRATAGTVDDVEAAYLVGVVAANLVQSNGIPSYPNDLTIASATASTVTLPTTYTNSDALPNDASHLNKVLYVVSGTGAGQFVTLTARVGSTREWTVAGMTTQLNDTSACDQVGMAGNLTLAPLGLDQVVVEAGINGRQALSAALALGGKGTIVVSGVTKIQTFKAPDGVTTRLVITASVDGTGRTAVTWTLPT